MIRRSVALSPEAEADLLDLGEWIADAASIDVAVRYVQRVERYVLSFDLASERGSLHADISPSLRVVGFEGRLTIAFRVSDAIVQVVGIFRAGQDWAALVKDR